MKKLLTLVLAIAFVFTFSIGVFADNNAAKSDPAVQQLRAEVKALVQQLNDLREQHRALHEQAAAKAQTIKDLLKAAKDTGSKDKIAAAKACKEQLKAINADIQSLREVKKELLVQVKNARSAKDLQAVKDNLTKVIATKQQIIEKVNQKLVVLDQIINTLR